MHNIARRSLIGLSLDTYILILVGVAMVAATTFAIKWSTRLLVEEAVGDQMVVQAALAAHLVAIAEQKRETSLTPAQINQHLEEIVQFTRTQRGFEYEFWITDASGKAYLKAQPQEFTFAPDQPQAGIFCRLLNGSADHTDVIVQESRRRELDPHIFKYVGVSGVDKSRIVQVGYREDSLLHRLTIESSLAAAAVVGLELLAGVAAYFILRRKWRGA